METETNVEFSASEEQNREEFLTWLDEAFALIFDQLATFAD